MIPGWRPRTVAHLTTVDLSLRFLLWAQLDSQRAAGVEVIGISAAGPHADWLVEHGVRHIPLAGSTRAMSLRADLRAARSLWRILREERPDVLHTHTPKPGVYGRIIGRLAGVPVVVNTVHGLYATTDDPFARRAVVYALEAVASRFSDAELYQSAEDHDLATRWHIVSRRKASVLGNGIDLDRFRPPTPDERREARAALGIGDDTFVVGFVGRLVVEKGLGELVEAHGRLAGDTRLVIVGIEEPDKSDAISIGADARTLLVGERVDVERAYHAFDVLCLPSYREGFPRTPMEAAATGLPVIVSDVRGCRQVVRDGETGLMVPARDVDALARALEALREPSRRARMGEAARAFAEEAFDERDVVSKVESAYRDGHARRRFSGRAPRSR